MFYVPSEWTEDGQLWVQYVSSTPATRSDVITLQEHLDQKLQQRQARETGICPIREELYAQCFGKIKIICYLHTLDNNRIYTYLHFIEFYILSIVFLM